MKSHALSHLSDGVLLRALTALVVRDRANMSELLTHIAEVDARKLYLPAAYPSMYMYCVHELHLSEDEAFKRITAARTARRLPEILDAVADGRLHLSGVLVLAPHLTERNSRELLAVAAHRSKSEIEKLLAARFPRTDVETLVRPVVPAGSRDAHSTRTPCESSAGTVQPCLTKLAPERVAGASDQVPGPVAAEMDRVPAPLLEGTQQVPGAIGLVNVRPRITPLAPRRYALQLTMPQRMHDKLRHAQALLGHALPSGDVAEVLERALDALIVKLERRKCAAVAGARPKRAASARRVSHSARHVPAAVKRAVWTRDQGRCTFVSDSGQRCAARRSLEFDHVLPVARGGRATVSGIRLRCRAHNQYEAESVFGADFMAHKRRVAEQGRSRDGRKPRRSGSEVVQSATRACHSPLK